MTDEDKKIDVISQDQQIENEQRQFNLLQDPNYGIILCFLDKFKSVLDLPKYSYQRLENHLLNNHEQIAPRLIDFHFILLKRLSLAKNTQREKFDSIITRFAYRFDLNDGDQLTETGYLLADISIKTKILKNLLEGQFDLNQTFAKTLVDRPAKEIKSTAIGRDRFGVSYWIFMDTDCFVRLFREDVDLDRTWCNIAKNREELENFIRLLITDSVVRKKFSDWIIDYEPFGSLEPTNEFEERYLPEISNVKDENSDIEIKQEENATDEEEKVDVSAKRKRGRSKVLQTSPIPIEIKKEEVEAMSTDEEKVETSVKRKRGRPKSLTTPVKEEQMSNDDEKMSESMKKKRGRPRSSIKPIKNEPKEEIIETKRKSDRSTKKVEIEEESISNRRGRKRKSMVEENIDEENERPTEETSLRRSSRSRKAPVLEPTSVLTPKTISQVSSTKKKRSNNSKGKSSHDQSINGRSRRGRKSKSRRNHHNDEFCLSSSSSDEQQNYLSEDEYDSDDYLPNLNELEQDENFFACDEDNQLVGEQLRTAKTAQDSTITTNCLVCSKSDRPDVLLLCDECDDAYHIDCLRPKLLSVPDGDWFCPLCEHRRLSMNLIEKLKELLINFNSIEQKRLENETRKQINPQRKIRVKDYSSDESQTASESDDEKQTNLDQNHLHADESMLSISQTNENSNISSTLFDDSNKNISQRGRHRRTRFDMNKMLNDDDDDDDDNKKKNKNKNDDYDAEDAEEESSSEDDDDDDEYIEHPTPITNFDLQIPKKMTRLLNTRYRPIARNDQRFQPKPIAPRLPHQTFDLNEKLGSPIIYINGEHNSQQIKSVITNSNQTLKIVRRWNDVQRRNKIRTTSSNRSLQETTSDCADENSVFCPDDSSPPRSNESTTNQDLKDDDSTIIRSKITLVQPTNLLPVYKSSTKNFVKKTENNFDQLTRDIQYAVSEANTLTTIPKTIDQQQIKRIQKTNFSPYLTKVALRPLPVLLPKPAAGIGYKIFKSKDPSPSATATTDLSNIILTPSSSSSLLDANDEQSSSTNA